MAVALTIACRLMSDSQLAELEARYLAARASGCLSLPDYPASPAAVGSFIQSRQAARLLGYGSPRSLLAFVKRQRLPFVQLNARVFAIEEAPLLQWLAQHRRTAA